MRTLLIGVSLACVAPASGVAAVNASTSEPSADEVSSRRALALEAVKLSYPSELARAESIRASDTEFRRTFASNPQNAALEKRFPGVTDAMSLALKSEMAKVLLGIEPKVLTAVAEDMASRLSIGDLSSTVAFYRSAAGQALLVLDPRMMNRQTGQVSLVTLSVEQRQAIGRYQESDAGRRAGMALSQSLQSVPQTAARLFAPYRAQIQKAGATAANSFIAKATNR